MSRFFSETRLVNMLCWLGALLWTGLVLFLMLSPGKDSTATWLSAAVGGSEITDAIGHVILFGGLVIWWNRALEDLASALVIGLLLGIGTEILQAFVPYRGVSLLDLGANAFGVLSVWWYFRRRRLSNT